MSLILSPPSDIRLLHDHYILQLKDIAGYLKISGWTSIGLRFVPKTYNQQLYGYWTIEALCLRGYKVAPFPVFNCSMSKKPRNYTAEDYEITFSLRNPNCPDINASQSFMLSKTQDCAVSFYQFKESIQDIWPSG